MSVISKSLILFFWKLLFLYRSLTESTLQPFHSSLSFSLMDYATNIPLFGEVELGREIYYQIGFQSCFKQDTSKFIAYLEFTGNRSSILIIRQLWCFSASFHIKSFKSNFLFVHKLVKINDYENQPFHLKYLN